jgi:peptidyl-prolyl cis-trans isomerase C
MTITRTHTAIITAAATITLAITGAGCKEEPTAAAEATPVPAEGTVVSEPVRLPPAEALPETIVTVNGEKLVRDDLLKELEIFTGSPQFAAMPPEQANMIREQMQSRLIDRFVHQQILTGEADKQNVNVTDADVDEMLENLKTQIPPGMTMEQILEQRGMDIADLRREIGRDLRIRALLEKQTESVSDATDEDIAAYYEENKASFDLPETSHARHILIKVDPGADEEAKAAKKAELEGYRQQIIDGTAEFDKLAAEHSGCPSGKRGGGDLGTFKRGAMVPEFDTAAFEQEVNVVGPIIETQFGYHIVQVLERNEAGQRTLEDVKEEIAEQLKGRKQQEAVETFIASLREQATITYGE